MSIDFYEFVMYIRNLFHIKFYHRLILSLGELVFIIGGYIMILTLFIKGMLQVNEELNNKNEVILMTLILIMEYCFVNHSYPNKIIKNKLLFFIETLLIINFIAYELVITNSSSCLETILELIINIIFLLIDLFV